MCVIAIDHLYRFPSFWDNFTGQGKLWVSAAEGFFIISGLLVGRLQQPPRKIFQRAFKLYCWSIGFTALFTWWGAFFVNHALKSGIWSGSSGRYIFDLLTLRYVYGWADFLPYYVVFLLLSPFVLLALRRGKAWLVLILSLLFWVIRGNNFYFAWQVLFFTGLVAGFHFDKFSAFIARTAKLLVPLAGITIAASSYFVFYKGFVLPEFDKITLGPGRVVLAWLWFSAFFVVMRRFGQSINMFTGGFLCLLGRNSLFVYGLQALILFPVTSWLPPEPNYWLNTLYAASVVSAIWLVVWLKRQIRLPRWRLQFTYHPVAPSA